MSLINKAQEKALLQFFKTNIQPLATEPNRSEGFSVANSEEKSYYLVREWTPLTRQSFEIPLGSRKEIAATLDAFWKDGLFQGFGQKIIRLSKKFPSIEDKSEVSTSIYEMF